MEGYPTNHSACAPENIHGQNTIEQNRSAKLWPSQRSTVARLGLLHRPRGSSQGSTSRFGSSDTFGSSYSTSKTNLFSELSPSPPSSHYSDRLPTPKIPPPKRVEVVEEILHPVSPLIQFDRQEALQALNSIRPQSHQNINKTSPVRTDEKEEHGAPPEIEIPLKNNEKSLEASQLILSGHESWVTCADFSNSMILKMKNPKEREEFTEMCSQALSMKLETYNRLSKKNSDIYQQQLEKLNSMHQDEYKSHLCKSMLKLINNEKLRQEQKYRNSESQWKSRMSKKYNTKKGMKQVYVVGGRTIVSDPLGKENFPNSFSSPSKLIDSRDDPPGYQRFKVQVDMKNLAGDQFSIQLYNQRTLVFKPLDEGSEIKKVHLPKGIFADKLRIAREGTGPLIIQEPWLF